MDFPQSTEKHRDEPHRVKSLVHVQNGREQPPEAILVLCLFLDLLFDVTFGDLVLEGPDLTLCLYYCTLNS